ncbi:unnamed protein product [Pylaiella littoralis]
MPTSNPTPSYTAITPHVKLFNIVKGEYTNDSTINSYDGIFWKYYLKNRWSYVNMARDCVKNKKYLRDCNILPPSGPNTSVTGDPFWFKINHTRDDGYKNTPGEICDSFWKSFRKTGCSLYVMGMTFGEIVYYINDILFTETSYMPLVQITKGDLVLSCRRYFTGKPVGWVGYKCFNDFENGVFKKSSVKISRPSKKKVIGESTVNKPDPGTYTIKPLVVKKKEFHTKKISVTTNFKYAN